MMYEVALLRVEVSVLRKANKGLSKQRRAKKIRVRLRGLLLRQALIRRIRGCCALIV